MSGSKTTGTSWVATFRAPRRRRVRWAAVRPTASGDSRRLRRRWAEYHPSRCIPASSLATGVTDSATEDARYSPEKPWLLAKKTRASWCP